MKLKRLTLEEETKVFKNAVKQGPPHMNYYSRLNNECVCGNHKNKRHWAFVNMTSYPSYGYNIPPQLWRNEILKGQDYQYCLIKRKYFLYIVFIHFGAKFQINPFSMLKIMVSRDLEKGVKKAISYMDADIKRYKCKYEGM